MTLTFYDAAYPPLRPPATDGVAFYIGGDTPHVWTVAEIGRQPARYRLPIWVRSSPGAGLPTPDARGAIQRLAEIQAPKGSLVALDLETAIDPQYVAQFQTIMNLAGYPVITYGSRSTVYHNDATRYWDADWTSVPHTSGGSVMTQYENRPSYDLSLAVPGLPFWDTWPKPVMTAPAGFSITGHAGYANLGWGEVANATDYNIEIRGAGGAPTGISFANFVVNAPQTHAQKPLTPGHYIGRVRAGNVHGWSEWTPEHGFLVMKP